MILGGSNAAPSSGWGVDFERLGESHVVVNRFLGAVGSLFAVLRLIKMEQEGETPPDLIVLEYLLNDMLIHVHTGLDLDMLADGLRAVTAHCGRRGIKLIALGLEPRLPDTSRVRRRAAAVRGIYRSTIVSCGVPLIHAADILRRPLESGDYSDDNHLLPDISARIAADLLDRVERGCAAIPPAPVENPFSSFTFVPAAQARHSGEASLGDIRTKVFSGPVLHLARASTSSWPGRGHVAGLLLRSDLTSGYYRLRAGGAACRKNAFHVALKSVPRPIILHYVRRRMLADEDLSIEMPASEGEITERPEDLRPQECPPMTPFAGQTVEILGVVLWRRPPAWRRAIASAGQAIASLRGVGRKRAPAHSRTVSAGSGATTPRLATYEG